MNRAEISFFLMQALLAAPGEEDGMLVTPRDREIAISDPRRKPKEGARKPTPGGATEEARELGMNPSTWRSRLRRVEAGELTLEEARALPIKSRSERGRRNAAKVRDKSGKTLGGTSVAKKQDGDAGA